MNLNVKNETSTLQAVVLGQPGSIGRVPTLDQSFDAKSYETISLGVPHRRSYLQRNECIWKSAAEI